MLGLLLDFDAIYTGIWVYAFTDVETCDTDEIIGSSLCIAAGWITWTLHGIAYIFYLTNVSALVASIIFSCNRTQEEAPLKKRMVNWIFYGFLIVFFFTFFPTHILSDNEEPLSCGCANSLTSNLTSSTFTCEDRPGVVETRLALDFYQLMISGALAFAGLARYSIGYEN